MKRCAFISAVRSRCLCVAIAAGAALAAGCGSDDDASPPAEKPAAAKPLDGVTKIDGARGLYARCTGSGSPTVILEGGDGDASDGYAFAESALAKVTRTCVYDRANLGKSDPAPGPRGLSHLVSDLERLLKAAKIPAPYVLVGTSGGGYITAGYAYAHPRQVAGMALIETAPPFRNPPAEIVEETAPDNPENVEKRDYLQVERDAWAGRKRIGDIPVTIVTDEPSAEAIKEAPPSERAVMRRNVEAQKGWLVLSPRAKQVVVHTGHAVEEEDPQFVIDTILGVVRGAR